MRSVVATLLLALGGLAAAQAPAGGVEHMRHVRQVLVQSPERQSYIQVDEETWRQARRDLGDLRLRDAQDETVPYAFRTRGELRGKQEVAADILQPGRVEGRTRFWIRIPDSVEDYDRIRLDLRVQNFVAAARVEGANEDDAREWVELGEHTLFDFSQERLGSSFVLQLPPTRFRYLRVTTAREVRPEQVHAAYVATTIPQEADWLPLSAALEKREEPGRTVFRWSASEQIPLERVRFEPDPGEHNFIRRVEIVAQGRVLASGTIRRVNIARGDRMVRIEELDVPVAFAHSERFEAIIHNADDRPLRVARILPMALERRLYFDPGGRRELQLYFGDPGAERPEYEYAKLFREDGAAQEARLGPATDNAAYRPRPDTRPWSDRHPWVLWSALILAVLALGTVALRSLRSA